MNLAFFNLREVEKKSLAQWQQENPNINIEVTEKDLSDETKHMLHGKDGVVISQIQPISKEIYELAQKEGIKVFATRSAGVDMYDRKTLNDLNIKLTNVPSYSPNAIAEYVVTAALQLTRNTTKIRHNVEKYNFSWNPAILSRELRTLTVGLVGTGRIGTATAKLFKGLGARVIGYDPYPNDFAKEYLEYVDDLDTLVKQSDILSLHMPAIEEYKHLVNDELLSKMPNDSVLINAARGMLVDTEAVIRALDNHKLLGAALDVYEFEAPYVPKDLSKDGKIDDNLLKTLIERDDVIYTPHTAYYTETAVANLVEYALASAKNVIETGADSALVPFK